MGANVETVVTARLDGHRPTAADADFAAALYGDPRVAATLWPGDLGGPRTPAQAAAIVEHWGVHWEAHGFGPWVFVERATGEPVGAGGVAHTTLGGVDVVEVLYAVRADRWGEGIAGEIARAAVDVAFGPLDLDELVCFTMTTNVGSQRAMAKAGFVPDEPIEHEGLPHLLARLRRA